MLRQIPLTCTPKLFDQLEQSLRESHYSSNAVETYIHWARSYICFHGFRHPVNMGASEVRQFLAYLVDEHKISYTTYIHALCALLFLYKKLLKMDIGWIDNGPPPTCPRKPIGRKTGKQIDMPLSHGSSKPPPAISSLLPPASRKKSKIGQTRSCAPGNARNCHAI